MFVPRGTLLQLSLLVYHLYRHSLEMKQSRAMQSRAMLPLGTEFFPVLLILWGHFDDSKASCGVSVNWHQGCCLLLYWCRIPRLEILLQVTFLLQAHHSWNTYWTESTFFALTVLMCPPAARPVSAAILQYLPWPCSLMCHTHWAAEWEWKFLNSNPLLLLWLYESLISSPFDWLRNWDIWKLKTPIFPDRV